MYERLVEALRNMDVSDACPCSVGNMCDDQDCIVYQAADAIEELSKAQEQWIEQERNAMLKSIPKWIPVTERLPEPGWYLVRCNEMLKHIHRIAYYYNHAWYENSNNITKFVTHWMPLPEPPKEET